MINRHLIAFMNQIEDIMIRELNTDKYVHVSGGMILQGHSESTNVMDCTADPYPCTASMVRGGEEYPVDANGEFVFD